MTPRFGPQNKGRPHQRRVKPRGMFPLPAFPCGLTPLPDVQAGMRSGHGESHGRRYSPTPQGAALERPGGGQALLSLVGQMVVRARAVAGGPRWASLLWPLFSHQPPSHVPWLQGSSRAHQGFALAGSSSGSTCSPQSHLGHTFMPSSPCSLQSSLTNHSRPLHLKL